MRLGLYLCIVFLTVCLGLGCSDPLSDIQAKCEGTWVLQSRELPDGTLLAPPTIEGVFTWLTLDPRKAHVTQNLVVEGQAGSPRRVDYAASIFEISTSAITRKRRLLLRQGYRLSSEIPMNVYRKGKTAKGKLSVENGSVKISHTKDDASARASLEEWQIQTFEGDAMVVSIPNVFKDTWKKIR